MTKAILPCLYLFLNGVWAVSQTAAPAYEFRNGNWFNGNGFSPATWYSAGGKFSKKAPDQIDSVIDLTGRWIIPPLGDAYCSSVSENPSAGQQIKTYFDEGIFYLQILGNTQEGRKNAAPQLNKIETPDAIFSNGALTCTLGYPFSDIEGPAQGIRNPQEIAEKYTTLRESRKMLGDGYWFVDGKADVDKNWEKIKALNPGVLAIYLLDATNSGGKETKGLSAETAKAVVKKAHKTGLRVIAHVETAEDVRLGLKLDVDGFANLPGHQWDGTGDGKKYILDDQDMKKLAKKKTPVIPLFSHAQTQMMRAGIQAEQSQLFKRLLDNGVNVIARSDDTQRTLRSEVNYWFQVGNLNYAQIIQILCVSTPQAIFPNRKLGRFEDGYEASFLVLSDNPLQNLLKIRAIAFKVKNGILLK